MRSGYFLNTQIINNEFIRRGYRLLAAEGFQIEGNRAFGDDWELELNEGFKLYREGNNFIVSRSTP
ncbi:MAG: hypothetical protein FWB91_11455 [Defluviitaleaceae bacterium]|nr:hypothetical protein [Defluviitaleaceae bacterium]